MAVEDSRLKIDSSNDTRIGVVTGCGLGGLSNLGKKTPLLSITKGQEGLAPVFYFPMLGRQYGPGIIPFIFRGPRPQFFRGHRFCGGPFAGGNRFNYSKKGRRALSQGGGNRLYQTGYPVGAKKAFHRKGGPKGPPFLKGQSGLSVGRGGAQKRGGPLKGGELFGTYTEGGIYTPPKGGGSFARK